jgi:hypothetical protein
MDRDTKSTCSSQLDLNHKEEKTHQRLYTEDIITRIKIPKWKNLYIAMKTEDRTVPTILHTILYTRSISCHRKTIYHTNKQLGVIVGTIMTN